MKIGEISISAFLNKQISITINDSLHQSTAASTWWCGRRALLGWIEIAVGLPEGLSYPEHSPRTIFSPCFPLNDRRSAAHSFSKIGRLSSPFSSLFHARLRLLILLLLLMSGNVYYNPGPITGSSLLTSSHLMTLTYLPFSMAPLAVAPPLIHPLLPPPLPFLAYGRCFRTWVLITYQFFYLSLSLRSFASTSVPPLSFFRKLAGMNLLLTLTLTVLLQKNTRLFSFLCCYSLHFSGTECGQIFHSFRLRQTPS